MTAVPGCDSIVRVLALAGPTAVGKTQVALELAEKLNGEIISVDSMQVYRGLNLGTAKTSVEERARVPHHLIDVADLSAPFDAAQFVTLANQAVSEICGRGRLPILCGGTGLYFKAFFHGLGKTPAGSPELRAELESTPLKELLLELSEKDAPSYASIDRQNPRRVIRAIEVIRVTGKPYSAQRADWSQPNREALHGYLMFGLSRSPYDLRARIDTRVDEMFRRGLLSETEHLLEHGLKENRTALQALGYRQVVDYLQGLRSLPETIALVKTRTRQFAKRQLTWFRVQFPATKWIQLEPSSSVEIVTKQILECGSQKLAQNKAL